MRASGPAPTNDSELYCAYLLRLWREGKHAPWRFSLQDSRSGERYHFAALDELVAFLRDRTGTQGTNKDA